MEIVVKLQHLILLAVILVPILLYVLSGISPFSNMVIFNKIPGCERSFNSEQTQGCYIASAVEDNLPELCNNLASEEVTEVCKSMVAVRFGNLSICQGLTAPIFRDSCISAVTQKS